MGFIIVIVGLLLSAYGAVLMLVSGGTVAGSADPRNLRRAKWRSRRAIALIVAGAVLVIIGALVLPLRNRVGGIGPTGVVIVVLLELAALLLDVIGIVSVFLSGVVLAAPEDLGGRWLDRAQRLTRIGIGLLFGGLLAQLGGIAVIAL